MVGGSGPQEGHCCVSYSKILNKLGFWIPGISWASANAYTACGWNILASGSLGPRDDHISLGCHSRQHVSPTIRRGRSLARVGVVRAISYLLSASCSASLQEVHVFLK